MCRVAQRSFPRLRNSAFGPRQNIFWSRFGPSFVVRIDGFRSRRNGQDPRALRGTFKTDDGSLLGCPRFKATVLYLNSTGGSRRCG
jgi:hypothetical protein